MNVWKYLNRQDYEENLMDVSVIAKESVADFMNFTVPRSTNANKKTSKNLERATHLKKSTFLVDF